MRTCCFTFRYSQGLAGGVIAGAKRELSTGSSIKLLSLFCGQGICAAQHRPEGTAICAGQHRPAPAQINCSVDHKLHGVQWSRSLPLVTQKRLLCMQDVPGWWSVVGQRWLTAKPSQPLAHSPSSAGKQEKIGWKSSWVETKRGRSLNNYCCRQTRLKWGKINLLPIKVDLGSEKQRQTLKQYLSSSISQAQLHSLALLTPLLWCGRGWGLQVVSTQRFLPATPFFSHFTSAPARFPHWSQLELAVSSPGQPLASSCRGPHCQHLGTITQCTDRPWRCICVFSSRTLASPSHCNTFFLCLSMCASGQTVASSGWDCNPGERL